MEWDHLPGEIKLGEGSTTIRNRSMQVTLDEIAKGDLVCANCHAVRTRARLMAKNTDAAVSEESAPYGARVEWIPLSAARLSGSANCQLTSA